MKFYYYIPHTSFFSKHPYGRVTHAIGVANGLAENGHEVVMIAESGLAGFTDRIHPSVQFLYLEKERVGPHFRFLFQTPSLWKRNRNAVFIYRKTIMGLVWILLFHLLNMFRKPKVVSEVNGFIFDYKMGYTNKWLNQSTELLHRVILRFDDLIYTVNEDLKLKLASGWLPIRPAKIAAIHNGGPNPNPIDFRQKEQAMLRLVFFGILADYNELELFIDLVGRPALKGRVTLEIVGFGNQLEPLQRYAAGKEGVNFYGKKSFPEFTQMIGSWNSMMAGIVPMRLGNSTGSLSPIKAFDYMSFGMPLIYSDLCLDGLAINGVHGFVYRNGDIESLEQAVIKIFNPATVAGLAASVNRDYHQHTWKARMEQLIKAVQ